MKENPNIVVQIGAHTDFRGGDNFNQNLSEGRAEAVIGFLIDQGIDSARFKAKGYGESRPRKLNADTKGARTGFVFKEGIVLTEDYIKNIRKTKGDSIYEDAQQLNRRVTLLKLSDDYNANEQPKSPSNDGGSGTKPDENGIKEE